MKRSRTAEASTTPQPSREYVRGALKPGGPTPPRVPLVRQGLYPARAAGARNCSLETPSDRAAAWGASGLARCDSRGLRSPAGACVRALGDERRPTTPALQRPSEKLSTRKGGSRATRRALGASPQKPCAVSDISTRPRVGPKLFARRAPCRKVLCSGGLDRHAQYNGARGEKASRESPARGILGAAGETEAARPSQATSTFVVSLPSCVIFTSRLDAR